MKIGKNLSLKLVLIILFSLSLLEIHAQDFSTIKVYEDSIMKYGRLIMKTHSDEKRLKLNSKLQTFVEKAIRQESSIDYAFDTLKFVSILTSDDKKFRIATWTIPMHDGHYMYFGISQSFSKNTKTYKYSKLNDQTPRLRRSESKTLSPKKWLGSYYYQIIQNKGNNKVYYTLLGWKGHDKVISMKVIEVATIRSTGDVVFGYPIFNIKNFAYVKNKRARRLVFKYSARVKMLMTYDTQSIHLVKKKKKKSSHKKQRGFAAQNKDVVEKVKVKTITKPMIIFDRLEPTNKEMEGVYEFYFPETNVVDALLFENNKWNYYPDIDARNNSSDELNAKPKKKLNYDL